MNALLRGRLTLQQTSGRIAELHRRAVNIETVNGYYISLVRRAGDMSALAIQLSWLPFSESDRGAAVTVTDTQLVVRSSKRTVIELSAAKLWDATLQLRAPADPGCIVGRLSPLVREHGVSGGFLPLAGGGEDNPFSARARQILEEAAAELRSTGKLRGLRKLVGLGPGLTPAGDDFLSGLLLCRRLLTGGALPPGDQESDVEYDPATARSPRLSPPPVESSELWHALERTTAAGRTLLRMSLNEYFSAHLLKVAYALAALCGANEAEPLEARDAALSRAVSEANAHGATSGTDALAGVFWYAALAVER